MTFHGGVLLRAGFIKKKNTPHTLRTTLGMFKCLGYGRLTTLGKLAFATRSCLGIPISECERQLALPLPICLIATVGIL